MGCEDVVVIFLYKSVKQDKAFSIFFCSSSSWFRLVAQLELFELGTLLPFHAEHLLYLNELLCFPLFFPALVIWTKKACTDDTP